MFTLSLGIIHVNQKKKSPLTVKALYYFMCGVWVCLNSMPIYIQSHMDAIYELGIYNVDILDICLPPTV